MGRIYTVEQCINSKQYNKECIDLLNSRDNNLTINGDNYLIIPMDAAERISSALSKYNEFIDGIVCVFPNREYDKQICDNIINDLVRIIKCNKNNYSNDQYFDYMVDEIIDMSIKELKGENNGKRNKDR